MTSPIRSPRSASGYRESGGYCAPISGRAPVAVPKLGQCPSKFAQSGAYCVEMRRSPFVDAPCTRAL